MIAECSKCGQPLMDDTEFCPHCKEKNPNTKVGAFGQVPWWGWVFIVACGAIPLVSLGGAIPVAIGLGGAGGCAAVSKKPDWSVGARVGVCAGIAIAAWAAFIALVAAVSGLQG